MWILLMIFGALTYVVFTVLDVTVRVIREKNYQQSLAPTGLALEHQLSHGLYNSYYADYERFREEAKAKRMFDGDVVKQLDWAFAQLEALCYRDMEAYPEIKEICQKCGDVGLTMMQDWVVVLSRLEVVKAGKTPMIINRSTSDLKPLPQGYLWATVDGPTPLVPHTQFYEDQHKRYEELDRESAEKYAVPWGLRIRTDQIQSK